LPAGWLLAALAVVAQPALAETRVNFVACPIVRDTSTVPCWLTEHEGTLYYMGIQTDVSAEFKPPYLGHQVLVEAVVSDVAPICGGIVLNPIKISVMPELDGSCNTILPAEDRYTIDFNPRPPGPSGGRLAFQTDPPAAPPARVAEQLAQPREIALYFDFDRSIAFRHPGQLVAIRNLAERMDASAVVVRATRGATLLSDGSLLLESAGVAERRRDDVVRLLRGIGVTAQIDAEWSDMPPAADGIDDWQSRGVIVTVRP